MEDVRNIITQARLKMSRYEWDEGNYEDEEKKGGFMLYLKGSQNAGTQRV
jgi:hypothetical protein